MKIERQLVSPCQSLCSFAVRSIMRSFSCSLPVLAEKLTGWKVNYSLTSFLSALTCQHQRPRASLNNLKYVSRYSSPAKVEMKASWGKRSPWRRSPRRRPQLHLSCHRAQRSCSNTQHPTISFNRQLLVDCSIIIKACGGQNVRCLFLYF